MEFFAECEVLLDASHLLYVLPARCMHCFRLMRRCGERRRGERRHGERRRGERRFQGFDRKVRCKECCKDFDRRSFALSDGIVRALLYMTPFFLTCCEKHRSHGGCPFDCTPRTTVQRCLSRCVQYETNTTRRDSRDLLPSLLLVHSQIVQLQGPS